MSSRRATIRGYIAALTGIALGSTVIAIAALPGLHPGTIFANHLASKLPNVPDDKLEHEMSRIAGLGDAAIPVMADALASKRAAMAEAAKKTINGQLDKWQLLSRNRSAHKVALLAKHLARNVERLTHDNQVAAAEMATEILLWPVNGESIDNGKLISNCETVLRAYSTSDPVGITRRRRSKSNSPSDLLVKNDATKNSLSSNAMAPSSLHTAGLPSEIVDIPSLPIANAKEMPVPPVETKMRFDIDESGRASESQPLSPDRVPQFSERPATPIEPDLFPPVTDLPRVPQSSGSPNTDAFRDLISLDHVSVMRLLRSPDKQLAVAATRELERRDFSDDDLLLALQFTSPNVPTRLELAKMLPRMNGVNSRRWLLWLSEDESALVRSEVVSILSTSSDPKIQRYLRDLAERETDPNVLRKMKRR